MLTTLLSSLTWYLLHRAALLLLSFPAASVVSLSLLTTSHMRHLLLAPVFSILGQQTAAVAFNLISANLAGVATRVVSFDVVIAVGALANPMQSNAI